MEQCCQQGSEGAASSVTQVRSHVCQIWLSHYLHFLLHGIIRIISSRLSASVLCTKMPCVLHNIVIDNACSDMHLNFVQAASKTSLQISIARDSVLAHKSTYVLLIVNWSVFTI